MRYMIATVLALCLASGSAMAQDHDHGRHEGGQRGDHGGHDRGGPDRGGHDHGDHDRGGHDRGGPGRDFGHGPERHDFGHGPERRDFGRGPDHRDFGRGGPGFDRRAEFHGGPPDHYRGPDRGFRPGYYLRDRGWRGGHFRGPVYRYPAGWGYRYWGFGSFLPSVFLATDYTLWQYWVYGLPAPPAGYHWIRVGPDALLVRYGDGYVLDAAYGLFY